MYPDGAPAVLIMQVMCDSKRKGVEVWCRGTCVRGWMAVEEMGYF